MTTCANPLCDRILEQPATGRRRRFCSDRCKQAFYRSEFRNATSPSADLSSEAMTSERTYGGHLTRDGSSVIDGCRQDERVDAQLRRLGYVRKPPRARVVQLPVARDVATEVAA
jgi:hypothetical protein